MFRTLRDAHRKDDHSTFKVGFQIKLNKTFSAPTLTNQAKRNPEYK